MSVQVMSDCPHGDDPLLCPARGCQAPEQPGPWQTASRPTLAVHEGDCRLCGFAISTGHMIVAQERDGDVRWVHADCSEQP